MANLIRLNIIAPGREVISEEVASLNTSASDGRIELLANCAPIIIATIPTVTTIIDGNGSKKELFTSSGIIYVKNKEINFCCDSVNFPEEIDKGRAEKAIKRAEERLKDNKDIDIERAKRSLQRAKARLEIK